METPTDAVPFGFIAFSVVGDDPFVGDLSDVPKHFNALIFKPEQQQDFEVLRDAVVVAVPETSWDRGH